MRIAVIGAGDMGTVHARMYRWLQKKEGVELAGVVSRSPGRAKKLAKAVGAPALTDLARVLRDDTIDAVDVVVPSGVHRRPVVAALERGKHVFVETPMALSMADADAMIDAARSNRRLLMVAQTMRFVATWRWMRDRVKAGDVGRPRAAVVRRLSRPYWSKPPRPFRTYGEPVVELMIFDLDFLNWVLGPPVRVHAAGVAGRSGVHEHVFASLEYDGARALAEGSGMMPAGWVFTTAVRITGDRGGFDFLGRLTGRPVPEETLLRYGTRGPPKAVKVPGHNPYAEECRHFVRCVQGRADPVILSATGEREALRVALAARESLRRRRPIDLR